MKIDWTKGLSKEDASDMERRLKLNEVIFDKQYDILQEWFEHELRKSLSEDDFGSGEWSHLHAYRSGKMKAYREVINLIKDLTSK